MDLRSLAEENILLPPRQGLGGLHGQIVAACHKAGFIPQHEMPLKLAQIAISLDACNVGIAVIPKSLSCLHMNGVIYKSLKQQKPERGLCSCRSCEPCKDSADELRPGWIPVFPAAVTAYRG